VGEFVIQGVTFNVGFINDIETELIAQVVKNTVVWIMGGANGVDVELLHQFDVGDHRFEGDGLAAPVIVIVAIDPFE